MSFNLCENIREPKAEYDQELADIRFACDSVQAQAGIMNVAVK